MRSLKKLSVVIISLFMVFVCLPVNSFAENTANANSVPAVELTAEDCMENNDEVEEEAICEEVNCGYVKIVEENPSPLAP